jgi:hypothetical protein
MRKEKAMCKSNKRITCTNCGIAGPEVLENESAKDVAVSFDWEVENKILCPACATKAWEEKLADALACLPDITTLETRNSDSLDFHELAIWTLKDALVAAYRAGQNS